MLYRFGLLLFLFIFDGLAQDTTTTKKRKFFFRFVPVKIDTTAPKKIKKPELFLKNEVSLNIDALVFKKVVINYERYINNNHCLRIGTTISDGVFQKITPGFFNFKAGYIGYFSKQQFRGFYVNPYFAFTNKSTTTSSILDFIEFYDYERNYDGKFLASGLNLGYKWGRRKLRFGSEIEIFRNILGTEKGFEPYRTSKLKMGLNLGYRF